MSATKDTYIYDYKGEQIYPYTNLSSIKIEGYKSTETSVENYPIYNYIKDCILKNTNTESESEYVDLSTDQTIDGMKTFTNTINGQITRAINDASGNNIANSFNKVSTDVTDISSNMNKISTKIDNISTSVNNNSDNITSISATINDISINVNDISSRISDLQYPNLDNYTGDVSIKGSNITITGIDSSKGNNINITGDVSINGYTNITGNVDISGNVEATNFWASSDERLKTFKRPIEINLDKLSQIKKSYFIFNEQPTCEHIGVSAQEIKKLYPEIVIEGDNGYLRVDYTKLSVIALAAIDILYNENIKLNNRINLLESKLN